MENKTEIRLYFGVISAMLAFVIITAGFIVAIIRYQKRLVLNQRELLELDTKYKEELLVNSIVSAEAERMQIAKDVHDEIGSIFSTLSLSLNRLKGIAAIPESEYETATGLIQTGIDSVRRISHAIVPFELELLGLEQTLENNIRTIHALSGMEIDFENTTDIERLSNDTKLALYRIFQELTSNCVKYSKANLVEIKLWDNREQMLFEYKDNGVGTDINSGSRRGIGLKNIEGRVLLLNGSVSFVSKPGEGFACNIAIPYI